MKVSGFTILRNGIKYGYPFREAIRSILPVCDELVVALGNSEDESRKAVEQLNDPRIRIIDTVWDENLRQGGAVLADETNKAFKAISPDSDWAFYIQADEVVHEKYLLAIRAVMEQHLSNKAVDGLLFKYLHFWGSYDYVGSSSRWYPNEIRIIRNDQSIYSYRDAQGFRKGNNKKLRVKAIDAYIYHYGWVREPSTMQLKIDGVGKFWGGNGEPADTRVYDGKGFDYGEVDRLDKFSDTHPAVMKELIARMNWSFEYDLAHNKLPLKEKFKNLVEQLTGCRPFDYQNYIKL
jgi:hypothetical protein